MFGDFTTFSGSLLSEFERMRREMDSMLESWSSPSSIRAVARGSFPAVNIGISPESMDIYVLAPGVDSKAFDVSIQKNVLTISGERSLHRPEEGEKRDYLQERFAGPFRRALTLPEDADPEQVQARYTDGVLHIRVGRREAAKPRQIEVK